MKPERLCLLLLVLGLAVPAAAAPAKPGFDAPTGLTLQARDAGRYQLLWDPIYRDDLVGYSVWLRRPGEREFTRLSVPVKVGKEVRKMPLVTEARVVLALGASKGDVEVAVVAEYEDGSSGRTPSAFTARVGKAAAAAPEGAATPAAEAPAGNVEEDRVARPGAEPPRPLLTPFGRLRSEWGLEFNLLRFMSGGNDRFSDLGLGGTGIDPAKQVNWKRVDARTQFSLPLTLRWGLLPGVEAWAQACYQAEDVFIDAYDIDGQNFDFIVPVRTVDGQQVQLSNPTSAGLGDSRVGARIQLYPAAPFLLGIQALIPSGKSRFQSFLEWNEGRSFPAGTGAGVMRMEFSVDFGDPGRRAGLSLHAGFSPGAVERLRAPLGGPELDHVVTWADRFEVGGAYTFPWQVRGRDGGVMLGATARSAGPARWTADGADVVPSISKFDQSQVSAHTLARFIRDDQIELSVQAIQDLPSGFRAGGRVAYVSGVQGDALRLSGQFFY